MDFTLCKFGLHLKTSKALVYKNFAGSCSSGSEVAKGQQVECLRTQGSLLFNPADHWCHPSLLWIYFPTANTSSRKPSLILTPPQLVSQGPLPHPHRWLLRRPSWSRTHLLAQGHHISMGSTAPAQDAVQDWRQFLRPEV